MAASSSSLSVVSALGAVGPIATEWIPLGVGGVPGPAPGSEPEESRAGIDDGGVSDALSVISNDAGGSGRLLTVDRGGVAAPRAPASL